MLHKVTVSVWLAAMFNNLAEIASPLEIDLIMGNVLEGKLNWVCYQENEKTHIPLAVVVLSIFGGKKPIRVFFRMQDCFFQDMIIKEYWCYLKKNILLLRTIDRRKRTLYHRKEQIVSSGLCYVKRFVAFLPTEQTGQRHCKRQDSNL